MVRHEKELLRRKAEAEAVYPDFPEEHVGGAGFDLPAYIAKVQSMLRAAGIPQDPVAVSWRDLTCSVPAIASGEETTVLSPITGIVSAVRNGFARMRPHHVDQRAKETKQTEIVLDGVSGHLNAGQMCVILGPAGCGASLLLRRIAQQDIGKMVNVDGDVLFNGNRHLGGFVNTGHVVDSVPQLDEHFPHLSVRDTMGFAAECKIPDFIPHAPTLRKNAVEIVAQELGIKRVLDTRVGSDALRGVSGGERRRVTIGEMNMSITSPIMALDNWSKGLDSSTTLSITRSLRMLSDSTGASVICSMTSPGVDVFKQFDVVTVLDQGKLLFFGPQAEAEPWFNSLGFKRPPQRSTPDFLSTVSDPTFRDEYLADASPFEKESAPKSAEQFSYRFAESHWRSELDAVIDHAVKSKPDESDEGKNVSSELGDVFHRTTLQKPTRQFKAVFKRDYTHLWARKSAVLQEFAVEAIFGLLLGSMFWQLPDTSEGASSRNGLLFLAIIFRGLAPLSKIPDKHRAKRVFAKQRNAAFYDAAPFVVSSTTLDICQSLLKGIIFTIPLWLMSGLQVGSSGQRLLYGVLIFWLLEVVVTIQLQIFVALFPGEEVAQAAASVIVLIEVLTAGYLRTGEELASYLVWLYWINPVHYAYEAIVLSEFDGLTFVCEASELIPVDPRVPLSSRVCPVTTGDAYLVDVLTITEGPIYRLYYFCVLVGFAVLFMVLVSVTTALVRPTGFAYKIKTSSSEAFRPGDSVTVDVSHQADTQSCLTFKDIVYSVDNGNKVLLREVTGCAPPGMLVALVGTSGAGKTTLLDVVAGRKTLKGGASQEGEVRVNGNVVTNKELALIAGYCEQSDLHIKEATVREALRFSAVLRLPKSTSKTSRDARISNVLEMLGLSSFAEVIVKSLGAAELKLLTLGVELVANPAVLFCDEPTSGLPTSSALQVVSALRSVANSGTAVVCTIHQPPSEVFSSFDRLLFLQRGGKTVYAGKIGASGSAVREYFEGQGGAPGAADGNVAEWMLEVVADESVDWHERWLGSAARDTHLEEVKQLASPSGAGAGAPAVGQDQKRAGVLTQISETMRRTFWTYLRLPEYNLSRASLMLSQGLIFGLIFLRDAASDGQEAVGVSITALYLSTIPATIVAQEVVPVSYEMRLAFYREVTSGTYRSIAHHIAFGLVELPFLFVAATIFSVLLYFLSGLTPSQFGYFFLAAQLLYIFAVYLGLALSALLPSVDLALTLANMIMTIFNVLSGFLLRKPNMPVYWRWFAWVNPVAYYLAGVIQNELRGRTFTCTPFELGVFTLPASATSCADIDPALYLDVTTPDGAAGCSFCPVPTGEGPIEQFAADDVSRLTALGALVAAIVVVRAVAAFGFVKLRFLNR